MSVRAKFKVESITRMHWGKGVEAQNIKLSPVYGNGDPEHENTKFYQATPGGEINLAVVNPDAGNYFELGQEYYIDFTKA